MRSLLDYHNLSREENHGRSDWKESLDNLPNTGIRRRGQTWPTSWVVLLASFPMAKQIPRPRPDSGEGGRGFHASGRRGVVLGLPLIGAGLPEKAKEMMKHDLEKVKKLGARQVVFSCPSCYRTWKERGIAAWNFLHSTQLIDKLDRRRSNFGWAKWR